MKTNIKDIKLVAFDNKYFRGDYAVVETDTAKWKYSLEYNDRTWADLEDYLDNVRTDFVNESEIGEGIEMTEIFYKLED